jgi:hypothetical protein
MVFRKKGKACLLDFVNKPSVGKIFGFVFEIYFTTTIKEVDNDSFCK